MPPDQFGSKRLWLHNRHFTPAVRGFLVANPLIVETGDRTPESFNLSDAIRPTRLDFSAKAAGITRTWEIGLDQFLSSGA
nr:hypothetical protein OH820_28435 [Streptomyces sp. NBC_00857]